MDHENFVCRVACEFVHRFGSLGVRRLAQTEHGFFFGVEPVALELHAMLCLVLQVFLVRCCHLGFVDSVHSSVYVHVKRHRIDPNSVWRGALFGGGQGGLRGARARVAIALAGRRRLWPLGCSGANGARAMRANLHGGALAGAVVAAVLGLTWSTLDLRICEVSA